MKQGEIAHIEYTRSTDIGGTKGETTERYILPTFVPGSNIKAIDVTDLTVEQRKELETLWEEYQQYYELAVLNIFNFSDWLSHSSIKTAPQKWRTFKFHNVKILD